MHNQIHERTGGLRLGRRRVGRVQEILDGDLVLERFIQNLLPTSQWTVDHNLNLLAQFFLHITLDAPHHEGFQYHMQSTEMLCSQIL